MITSSFASKILTYIEEKRRAEEGDALACHGFRQLWSKMQHCSQVRQGN